MNDSNFRAEFVLPEDLQRQLDEIGDKMTVFIIKTMYILYPDGDFPENVIQEVVALLIPKVNESLEKAVNRLLGDQG